MAAPYTPPEQPKLDAFSSTTSPLRHTIKPAKTPPIFTSVFVPPSPPFSPESRPADDKIGLDSAIAGFRDPELFSDRELSVPISRTGPLFSSASEVSADDHYGLLSSSISDIDTKSNRDAEDLFMVQRVVDAYNANSRAYIRRELDMLRSYPSLVSRQPSSAHVASAAKRILGYENFVSKRSRTPRRSFGSATEKKPRMQRAPRADASAQGYHREQTDEIHHRKAPAAVPHRDDVDYESLEDFSPPTATLPHGGKALKAEWRGHPLDLSSDPDRHQMHDAEIALAATLRLSCAQYLCSKRRIFISRLECLRNGKEFRKTTAQQACKIDVNKASKLWTAFDKVGWFDPKHMMGYV